jgi:hypothetical protein
MTPREIVYRTLEFDSPERIPRQMWTLPWAGLNYPEELADLQSRYPDDIVTSPAFLKQNSRTEGNFYEAGHYIDEWGCEFENIHEGIVGEVKKPLITDWDGLNDLLTPDELLSVDKVGVNRFCQETDRFVIGAGLARPFERLQWMRTTEQLFMDLALEPENIKKALSVIHDFYLREMELWCSTDVDAVFFMDDWGSQTSLLISLEMWREFFKPLYKDYIELAHQYDKKIFFHSDGFILDIIPELIELGIDALNSQVFCMGPKGLGDQFAGKITFWGEMDRQHLLPEGTAAEIEAASDLLFDSFYRDGGLITQCEFGPGAKPENIGRYFHKLSRYIL